MTCQWSLFGQFWCRWRRLCWWQVWDVGDRFLTWPLGITIRWWSPQKITNTMIPTSRLPLCGHFESLHYNRLFELTHLWSPSVHSKSRFGLDTSFLCYFWLSALNWASLGSLYVFCVLSSTFYDLCTVSIVRFNCGTPYSFFLIFQGCVCIEDLFSK